MRSTSATACLGDVPGLEFMPEAAYDEPAWWLTCLTVDPAAFGGDRETIRRRLHDHGIEARPVWKPMHLQPAFRGAQRGGDMAAKLIERGLCLPSGSSLSDDEHDEVVNHVRDAART